MKRGIFSRPPILGLLAACFVVACGTFHVAAQAPQPIAGCPQDVVCLTRSEMAYYLKQDDKAKALDAEVIVLKQAVDDHKKIETDLKVELAKKTGELSGSEAMNVRQTAIIDILIKQVRPKKIGIINF